MALGHYRIFLHFSLDLSRILRELAFNVLIYVILAQSLNIIIGFAGLLNLGHAAFFGVGAYTYGILWKFFQLPFILALPLSAVFAALTGLLLGLPVLRVRHDYIAIVTLGFGEVIKLILNNWTALTDGPNGYTEWPRLNSCALSLNPVFIIITWSFFLFTLFYLSWCALDAPGLAEPDCHPRRRGFRFHLGDKNRPAKASRFYFRGRPRRRSRLYPGHQTPVHFTCRVRLLRVHHHSLHGHRGDIRNIPGVVLGLPSSILFQKFSANSAISG